MLPLESLDSEMGQGIVEVENSFGNYEYWQIPFHFHLN